MRHVILTCKNHPNLRWSTKEIAITDGVFNGCRSLFFMGTPVLGEKGEPKMHDDGSGLQCNEMVPIRNSAGDVTNYTVVEECSCEVGCLVIAPEDSLVKRHS